MSRPALAWGLVAVTVACVCAQVVLLVVAGVPLISREALTRTFPIVPVAVVVGAVVGALIVARHPRHRIGWLFCIGQAGAAIGLAAQTLGSAVREHGVGSSPRVGEWAWWVGGLLGARYALTLVGILLLLAPDGHLPSPRWRPVLALQVASFGLGVVGLLLTPPSRMPGDAPGPPDALSTQLTRLSEIGLTLGLLGGAVALVVRLRRARSEERQQLRWIAGAGLTLTAAVTVTLIIGLVRGSAAPPYVQTVFLLGYLTVPVATGVAVLRHRLYDIDVIVGSAVRLAVLAAFVTAGYVVVVVAIGTVLGGAGAAVWASVLAYAVVALAFQPLRRQVDRLADRMVYGTRAAPYDSLAEFSRRLAANSSDPSVLTLTARASAEVAGAERAVVRVAVAGAPDLTASWPDGCGPTPATFIPVRYGDEFLGEIGLTLAPGRSLTRAQRRLLGEFAAQDGLAFRNLALTAALEARAAEVFRQTEELAASRRRLVSAADTERALVATAIRREVIDRLTPVHDTLGRLEALDCEADVVMRSMDELENATETAIDALRLITGGVFPPLLARRGLAVALQSFAPKSTQEPEFIIGDGIRERRFPPAVEAAAYLCCVEAVRGMAFRSELRVDAAGNRLVILARGLRAGTGEREQTLVDRVEALGGQVISDPSPDGRSSLRVLLPFPGDQAQDGPSQPKPHVEVHGNGGPSPPLPVVAARD